MQLSPRTPTPLALCGVDPYTPIACSAWPMLSPWTPIAPLPFTPAPAAAMGASPITPTASVLALLLSPMTPIGPMPLTPSPFWIWPRTPTPLAGLHVARTP